ncbi:hypothetical protein CFE70_001771 [Pyrenophora teres f. teres 0-1]
MEAASVEGNAPLHPQLRQRMLNRAATVAEGALSSTSPTAMPRRRSSVVSNLSDTRYSLGSSTDNLLRVGKNDMDMHASLDEPSRWITLPVFAAVVPAIIGLTVENGAAIATDVFILVLAGWFLHWSVRVPWDWYHDAQQRLYVNDQVEDTYEEDTILEEDGEDDEDLSETQVDVSSEPRSGNNVSTTSTAQKEARDALKRTELFAFAGCFLGPLLGALLMHTIHTPMNRLIKMRTQRILHLQRIFREAPREPIRTLDAQQLSQRLSELEGRLDGVQTPNPNNNIHEANFEKITAEVRQTTQIQLDGLTRAVRRYEKRHMVQSLQIEARFQDLESRLKDALALAAAAARTGQRPGLISKTLSWIVGTVSYTLQTGWDIVMYPFRTAAVAFGVAKSMFVRDERQGRRRGKGVQQGGGYTALSSSRMQGKLGK